MNKFFVLTILLLGLVSSTSKAQIQPTLWFHELDKDDKYTLGQVLNIFQDTEGFTWFGTERGLYRFDGQSIKPYTSKLEDSTSIKDNLVNSRFFEDSERNLWFCTNSAIHVYQRKADNFKRFYLKKQGLEVESGYEAIFLERDSILWLKAGGNDIYWFNIKNHKQSPPLYKSLLHVQIFPGVDTLGNLRYLFPIDGSDGPGLEVIRVHHDKRLELTGLYFQGEKLNQPALKIFTVFFESVESIWLSSEQGILNWNLLTNERSKLFNTGTENVKSMIALDSNTFLVSDNGQGLFLFNKSIYDYQRLEARILDRQDFTLNENIRSGYLDPQGNLWFYLDSQGVIYSDLDKPKLSSLPKFEMYNSSKIYRYRTIIQDTNENIWVSTFFDGIFLAGKDGKLLDHYHPKNPKHHSFLDKQAFHMLLDNSNNLWIGTATGVAMKEPNSIKFKQVFDIDGKSVPYVIYFYQLKSGEILASTFKDGLYLIVENENKWSLKPIFSSFSKEDNFSSIYEDENKNIYICYKTTEVWVFNFLNGQLVKKYELPIPGFIHGFQEDEDGKTLWMASSLGLVEIDKTDFSVLPITYTEEHGMISNQLLSIATDSKKDIWISTIKGLSKFDPEEKKFVNFSLADGMQSETFYEYSVLNHSNGSIWFGGNNGITIVEPDKIVPLVVKPKIRITEIKINGKFSEESLRCDSTGAMNVSEIHKLTFRHNENSLNIKVAALEYSDPSANQFRYRMNDGEWIYNNSENSINLSFLSPNEYNLEIDATNSDGIWSEAPVTLQFEIKPHWLRSKLAIIIYFLLIAALAYAYYRYRIGLIRKEAAYKQMIAETETAVLRLQMNPHFIFNSMNSISSYILTKDIDTANDYLGRFARLMRMILDFAAKSLIEVADEIELLTLYLQAEAMRFEGRFDYEIEYDEEFDPDEYMIPPMILQPFVENAILHGFTGKKEKGLIKLRFWEDDSSLYCSVEDNGIGREAAAKTNRKAKSHESKALSITKRRMELLERKNDVVADIKFIDLHDLNNAPTGTRVLLRFPTL